MILALLVVVQAFRPARGRAASFWRFTALVFLAATATESYAFAGMPTVVTLLWFATFVQLSDVGSRLNRLMA